MRGWSTVLGLLLLTVPLSGCLNTAQNLQQLAEATECFDASGVDNQVGAFSYGGAVACKDGTETFGWENPGARATVEWGGAVGNGTLHVTILDSVDRVVYDATIDRGASGESGSTELGVPGPNGQWTVQLEFTNVTGSMGLTLETA